MEELYPWRIKNILHRGVSARDGKLNCWVSLCNLLFVYLSSWAFDVSLFITFILELDFNGFLLNSTQLFLFLDNDKHKSDCRFAEIVLLLQISVFVH